MYNGIQKMEEIINYIETNITGNIDCNELAAKMNLSVYEFRRIFSFIIGCPISEYIRKRRLSLAACEIAVAGKVNILELSQKYGYSSESAFIKAFKAQHEVSPNSIYEKDHQINLLTKPKLEFNISGRDTVLFQIIKEAEFGIRGYTGISGITESCCCENVWDAFYASQTDKKLTADNLYVAYHNEKDTVRCTIGEKVYTTDDGADFVKIPESRWACFRINTTDDDLVNKRYSEILYEWLPSADLTKNNEIPPIEVFPFDMSADGFEWEIRIPIK